LFWTPPPKSKMEKTSFDPNSKHYPKSTFIGCDIIVN
jgi:hypothetical protein